MTITITPGRRDEDKISQVIEAKKRLSKDEWNEYFEDRAWEDSEWLDALYYATEDEGESAYYLQKLFSAYVCQ